MWQQYSDNDKAKTRTIRSLGTTCYSMQKISHQQYLLSADGTITSQEIVRGKCGSL